MRALSIASPVRLSVVLCSVGAVVIAVIIYFALRPSMAIAAAAEQAVPVSVAQVISSEVSVSAEFSGRIESIERVEVRSRVAGPVTIVHFREGELVKKGELLITIDPAPYAAELERSAAQVAVAKERSSYTKSEFERTRRLLDERAISKREYDTAQNSMNEATANQRAAEAALQSARLNVSYTQVRAPVAGRVGRREVTVGNLVAAGPGAPVLTTLVSVNPIYASFDADELVVAKALRDVQAMTGEQRGRIEAIPVQMGTALSDGTPYEGHLQLVDNQVDAKSGTVRVRAVFDNKDGRLMAGQFAKLRMGEVKKVPALLIDERAVGTDQSKKFVMVVGPDNKANYREVTLGATVDGLRIAVTGLKADERVVVNGLQRVKPGGHVQPKIVPMERKTGTPLASRA